MMIARTLRGIDYSLVLLVSALVAIGLTAVFGLAADSPKYADMFQRQAIFAVISAGAMLLVAAADYRKLLAFSPLIYGATLALLVATAKFGVVRNGARSWLAIPGLPMELQTSEFAKLAVIMVLARLLARHEGRLGTLWQCLPAGLLTLAPLLFVLKQPDLGGAVVFVPIAFVMLVLAGLSAPLIALLVSPALAALALAQQFLPSGWVYALTWLALTAAIFTWTWHSGALKAETIAITLVNVFLFVLMLTYAHRAWEMLAPHQKNRVLVYTNPGYDPTGAGWQIEQSKIAIGSGGLIGKGLGKGTQSHLNFLAETPTDFVFAVLAEEWGFVGGSLLVLLFGLLLLRGIDIARGAADLEGGLLAGGIVAMLMTHLFVNVGMTMGLMPVTGLPLSFVSYGGSGLLTNMIAVGLLLSIYRRRDAR